MVELLEICVSGANIVPTVLLVVALGYWLFVLTGVVGLDLFDFDLDLDGDIGDVGDVGDLDVGAGAGGAGSVLSIGAIVLKSLNIGRVPIMVWFSLFALSFWVITIFWDLLLGDAADHASLGREILIFLRNAVFAVIAAKLLSQPLRGQFQEIEAESARDLIGRECAVTTSEVNPRFGQVRCETGAAPLLLNARTQEETEPLRKGDTAVIVDYDPHQGIYFVERVLREDPS